MLRFHWPDWIILAIVPVACLALGMGRSKPTDWVDYFLARSRLSTSGTLSNYIGANLVFTAIFLVLTLEATRRGLWVLAVPIAWIIGTIWLIYIYPRLVPYLQAGHTLHQALGDAFDSGQSDWRTVRRWASLWTIAAFVGGVSLEFYGAIQLLTLAGLTALHTVTLAILLAFVCAVFTISGGLRGVSRVNYFLDAVSITGISILFYYIVAAGLNSGISFRSLATTAQLYPTPSLLDNILFVAAAMVLFVPMQICALDTWQRGVAWKERARVSGPLIMGASCIAVVASIAIVSIYRDAAPVNLRV